MKETRPTIAKINLSNLEYNYNAIKKLVGDSTDIMGIVKANGYGHGIVQCAQKLEEIGCKYFGVASLDEAIILREAEIQSDILILGYSSVISKEYRVTYCTFSYEFAKALSIDGVNNNRVNKIHIKYDTGMNRLGIKNPKEVISLIKKIKELPNIDVEGIFTHFADSDNMDKSYALKQLQLFQNIIKLLDNEGIKFKYIHCANSAAVINIKESHFNLVRPGICMYGLYPNQKIINDKLKIKPVMEFKSKISQIKRLKKDETIGYGRTYTAKEDMVIAVVPVGYGDGFSRAFSNIGCVLINKHIANIVGTVCMDQLMIDISNISKVKEHDDVVFFNEELNASTIAKKINTINYEITTAITSRVHRIYIKGDKKWIK